MGLATYVERLPMDILRAAQAEVQHPRTDGRIGQLVDEDEPAERSVVGIGFKDNRLVGAEFDDADAVEAECLGREMVARGRSEERRVGKECVRPCRSRWSANH